VTRFALFAATVGGVLAAAPSRAEVEVAPPPREVRPDGSRAPAPAPEKAAKPDNPIETVERIIKNSKAVGDKLAMTDTGADTRTTQDKILKDIDSLLDRQDNPPPQSSNSPNDKTDQKNQDKDQSKDKKPEDKDPSGGKNDAPMKKDGMNPGGGMDPKGGDNTQANAGRRPRAGAGKDEPKDADKQPGKGGKDGKPDPPAGGKPESPANPKGDKGGPGMAGTNPTGKPMARPSLPFDDEVVKEVWGHLPDKLRQQVTQYYKEQFMPRYADLLKQYYSSLANAPTRPGEMRK
jgi:hypothetical protein